MSDAGVVVFRVTEHAVERPDIAPRYREQTFDLEWEGNSRRLPGAVDVFREFYHAAAGRSFRVEWTAAPRVPL